MTLVSGSKPVIRALFLAIGWLLVCATVIVGVFSLFRFGWSRRILADAWFSLGMILVLVLLAGGAMALLSIRVLVGPITQMRRVPRALWTLVGAILALVSVYVLAAGLSETEWSMSGDSCISQPDQPPGATGYRVGPSGSPPWGVVCTYRLESGRSITLPQWYPERGLPYVAVALGLGSLYAAGLATFGRRAATV